MNERKKSGHGTAINKMMNNESMIRVLVYAKKERKKRTREKKPRPSVLLASRLKKSGIGSLTPTVRSESLGLRILSALSLHKRWIEVSLHAISTAASATGHHSHAYKKRGGDTCRGKTIRKKNSVRTKRDQLKAHTHSATSSSPTTAHHPTAAARSLGNHPPASAAHEPGAHAACAEPAHAHAAHGHRVHHAHVRHAHGSHVAHHA